VLAFLIRCALEVAALAAFVAAIICGALILTP
jgi:hypothetical protein